MAGIACALDHRRPDVSGIEDTVGGELIQGLGDQIGDVRFHGKQTKGIQGAEG
jgi:hypothetical protein